MHEKFYVQFVKMLIIFWDLKKFLYVEVSILGHCGKIQYQAATWLSFQSHLMMYEHECKLCLLRCLKVEARLPQGFQIEWFRLSGSDWAQLSQCHAPSRTIKGYTSKFNAGDNSKLPPMHGRWGGGVKNTPSTSQTRITSDLVLGQAPGLANIFYTI